MPVHDKSNGTHIYPIGGCQGFWLTQNEHRNFRPVFESEDPLDQAGRTNEKTFERENEEKTRKGKRERERGGEGRGKRERSV